MISPSRIMLIHAHIWFKDQTTTLDGIRLNNSDATTQLEYFFAPPESIMVNEEYLIYDIYGMIGSVGGTLGICIGFSFSNVIAYFLNFLPYLQSNLTEKFTNKLGISNHIDVTVKSETTEEKIDKLQHQFYQLERTLIEIREQQNKNVSLW